MLELVVCMMMVPVGAGIAQQTPSSQAHEMMTRDDPDQLIRGWRAFVDEQNIVGLVVACEISGYFPMTGTYGPGSGPLTATHGWMRPWSGAAPPDRLSQPCLHRPGCGGEADQPRLSHRLTTRQWLEQRMEPDQSHGQCTCTGRTDSLPECGPQVRLQRMLKIMTSLLHRWRSVWMYMARDNITGVGFFLVMLGFLLLDHRTAFCVHLVSLGIFLAIDDRHVQCEIPAGRCRSSSALRSHADPGIG